MIAAVSASSSSRPRGLWGVSGAGLSDWTGNSTGPSLGDSQFGWAMINPRPATGGAWQIPASASFKISLSQDQLVPRSACPKISLSQDQLVPRSACPDQLVQRQIRDRLPKTAILLLQVLKTLGPVRTKAALFLAPAIVTLLRYAARATSLTNRLARGLARRQGHLGVAQHADCLFRGVAFTAHFVLLSRGQNAPHSLDKYGPLLGGRSNTPHRRSSRSSIRSSDPTSRSGGRWTSSASRQRRFTDGMTDIEPLARVDLRTAPVAPAWYGTVSRTMSAGRSWS